MSKWIQTKYPGIRYRNHPTRKHGINPDRYFSIRYYVDGVRKEEGLGWSSEGMTQKKADDELAELKLNARRGEGPRTYSEKRELENERKRLEAELKAEAERTESERKRLDEETILDSVFLKYCEHNTHKKSLKDEISLYKHWIQPVIGKKRLQEIVLFNLEKIKSDMLKAGKAERSIQYVKSVIRLIFNYAKDHNLFSGENPTNGFLKRQKFDNKRKRYLTPAEATLLLEDLKKHSITVYRITLLSLYTGMRFGEIAKLQWQHINMTNKAVIIIDPKNSESRTAFMVDAVFKMFSEMEQGTPDALVFPDKYNKVMSQISDSFMDSVNRLGFNDGITDPRMKVVFHTVRHSCASLLINAGADLPTIQVILGHKSIAMTQRYTHIAEDRIKAAMNMLEPAMTATTETNRIKRLS